MLLRLDQLNAIAVRRLQLPAKAYSCLPLAGRATGMHSL